MRFFKNPLFLLSIIVVAAILVRIICFLITVQYTPNWDVFTYKQWMQTSYSYGISQVYKTDHLNENQISNMPPGTILTLRGSYDSYLGVVKILDHFLHLKEGVVGWINDELLWFFLRLPSIVSDIIIGIAIYYVVKLKTNAKVGLISSAFFLFNPAVIYNSAIWGQMDSINNMFFYLSLAFLISRRTFLSILSGFFSLFVKISLFPLLPLYMLIVLFGKFFSKSRLAVSLIASTAIIYLLTTPFSTQIFWLPNLILQSSGGLLQNMSNHAFNFWWIVYMSTFKNIPPVDTTKFLGLSIGLWGYIIFAIFCAPILLKAAFLIKRKKLSIDYIFLLLMLTAFAAFLFLPKMHERYLYPVLPLFITWIGLKSRFWIWGIGLSLVHFLNLYIVWHQTPTFGIFQSLVESPQMGWFLSFCTIIIFIRFYLELFPISCFRKIANPVRAVLQFKG